jgi:hypothetical protein
LLRGLALDDNKFLLKFKELPLDELNASMAGQLQVFERYCNKHVILLYYNGQMWSGFLRGYDMFQLHLERNGEIEKHLLADVDKITEVKNDK